MLKKQQRLTKKEFDTYFKSGKRSHSPLMQLIYAPDSSFHGAAVAGKKVSKKAVERNTIRRRMYAALYALSKEEQLAGVYIMIAKPEARSASYSDIKATLSKMIKTR